MKKLTITLTTLLLLGVLLGLAGSLFYLQNRIYPNISIAGVYIGRLSYEQALNKLYTEIGKKRRQTIVLTYKNIQWHIDLDSLQYKSRPERSIQKALSTQSLRSLLTNKEVNLSLDFTIDKNSLQSTIASISSQLSYPPQNPQIIIENKKVEIAPGQDGQELNQKQTIEDINKQFEQLKLKPIKLPVKVVKLQITDRQIQNTKKRAEKLLDKQLILSIENNLETVKEQKLLDLLDFAEGYNSVKIADFTATLSKSYARQPQNAAFQMQNNKIALFKPAKNGLTINQELSQIQIEDALYKLEKQDDKSLTITLAYKKISPQIGNSDVNELGIKELLGRGVSYFYGSDAGRIHNLSLAAARVNGVLVAPGEVFSFNSAVGDISSATGYRSAYIIKEGRTILDDGGGVCQDSTTLFRAVLNAGLPVVERKQHAYRVVYYEKGGYKPGLDATVFAPSADFKFKNDTPAHILIQTYINKANSQLTYEIYGTSDGRIATITNHRVWDQMPPPEPLYQDDTALPAGTVKQVDFAAWGAKAAFDYRVKRGGDVIIEQTFYSNFHPWQAVYLRGTAQ